MAKATPALEVTTTDTPPKRARRRKPIATEKHTVVTEWEEEKKIGTPKTSAKARKPAPVAEEFEEDDADDVDVELPDEVQAVLAEYNTGEGLIMEVNRLPHYHLNGKQDPGSLVGLGDRDFDPYEYKNILRLYYAKDGVPNYFILRLKSADRRWIPGGRIGPICVEAATAEEKARYGIYVAPPEPNVIATINQATPQQPPYPYQVMQPPAPIDEDAIIDREFTRLERLKKLLNGASDSRRDEAIQQQPRYSEEDHIIRAAMSSPDAQERVAKGIFSKLIGGAMAPDETPWYADLIKDFAISLAPGINALMQAGAHKMVQAQVAVAQQQQQMPAPSLPEYPQAEIPPQQMQPMPQPVTEQPHQPEPEEILFGMILSDCVKRKIVKPEMCARNVFNYVDQFRNESGWTPFDAGIEIFIGNDVQPILDYAAAENPIAAKLAQEPDVLPWIKNVQDEIRKEWANDGESTEQG